ncbi:hypothetical protein CFC21_094129 [Triticum aestivum]|nr:proline-rich protein 9 [Aegilops tauschii subsp. strangulata]KAF7091563.1 hypothetical protein CFC21_094129 [Triticum aestivum]
MVSDAPAFRTTVVLAAVLAVLVLAPPSLACEEGAPAPAPALAPAPAPAPVMLCGDCESRCQARSTCEAYVAAAGCGNECDTSYTPECEPCKSRAMQSCTTGCNSYCLTNCQGSQCDNCATSCGGHCTQEAVNACRSRCTYSYYQVKSCKECQSDAARRCIYACNTQCKANCVVSG